MSDGPGCSIFDDDTARISRRSFDSRLYCLAKAHPEQLIRVDPVVGVPDVAGGAASCSAVSTASQSLRVIRRMRLRALILLTSDPETAHASPQRPSAPFTRVNSP